MTQEATSAAEAAPPGVSAEPRPVKLDELVPYAKKKCTLCCGRGHYMVTRRSGRTRELCVCTHEPFLAANIEKLFYIEGTGEWFWRPGRT